MGSLRVALVAFVVAPITEEVVFRGVFLRILLDRFPVKKAIHISALLFAGIHLNPRVFSGAFMLGLILAWIYIKTRSLILCILSHSFANAITGIFRYVGLHIPGFTILNSPQPVWFTVLGLVAVVGGVARLTKMFKRYGLSYQKPMNLL